MEPAFDSRAELNRRIKARLDVVRKEYDVFLENHPDSSHGHLAYGSFLDDIGEEDLAGAEFESACKLDPKNPGAWNDLANFYGESGGLTNAFMDYTRAIELDPTEPVYYQNFATTVYLFRKDAEQFYGINEQQVFDKSLDLYRKAIKLDPGNFALATDYAESYYGIKPLRTNDALVAWTNALNTTSNEVEREGVYIHLARVKLAAGWFADAQANLNVVTNPVYAGLKDRLERNLAARENAATNPVVAMPANSLPQLSTNVPIEVTNGISTSIAPPLLTNGVPAMSNPPVFNPKTPPILPDVPTTPPKPIQLNMPQPGELHPMPQTPDTNSP